MRKGVAVALVVALGLVGATVLVVRRSRHDADVRESHTVAQAVRRVAKLSTVEVSISNWQLRRDAKPLFGFLPWKCEKSVAVLYKGKVAAGFDLDGAGLQVVTSPRDRQVKVRLPAARLMYTDVPPPELVVADGSVCNRLEASDYAQIHQEARQAIEQEALQGGLLLRAETHVRLLLEEVARPLGYRVEVQVAAAPIRRVAIDRAH